MLHRVLGAASAASLLSLSLVACSGKDAVIHDDLGLSSGDASVTTGEDGGGTTGDDDGGQMSTGDDGGTSSGGDATVSGGDDAGPVTLGSMHTGTVTYYAKDISNGNCSFGPNTTPYFAAMSLSTDYEGSAACGECIDIKSAKGEVTVLAVDSCPGCDEGHIDLSTGAFDILGDESAGVLDVTWQVVSCDVTGPIQYAFTTGISEYYFSVQIRNSKYPIAKLELADSSGNFVEVERETYNEFVKNSQTSLPWTLRVTSSTGETLTDTFTATNAGQVVAGHAQF